MIGGCPLGGGLGLARAGTLDPDGAPADSAALRAAARAALDEMSGEGEDDDELPSLADDGGDDAADSATDPNCAAVREDRAPLKLPTGVRAAETMTMSLMTGCSVGLAVHYASLCTCERPKIDAGCFDRCQRNRAEASTRW